jgi:hypothetical protein
VLNFADIAEHFKPSAVNMSTTQIVQGPRRTTPGMPCPTPFGERDPKTDVALITSKK